MANRVGVLKPLGRRVANVPAKGPAAPGGGGKHREGGMAYAGKHVMKSAFGVEHTGTRRS